MSYVFSTHFSNIINLANEKNLGVLLVGYIIGPFYAGLFKAARSIVKIIRRIMDPLLDIAYPEFISLVNKGRLNDLIKGVEVKELIGSSNLNINDFHFDSRKIKNNCILWVEQFVMQYLVNDLKILI